VVKAGTIQFFTGKGRFGCNCLGHAGVMPVCRWGGWGEVGRHRWLRGLARWECLTALC
jgi:hypothetical protein